MGISADLIVFGGEGNNFLDDLGSMSLYDFLPESLHQYIYKTKVKVYDLEYYQELHKIPDLVVYSIDSEDGLCLVSESVRANWDVSIDDYSYYAKNLIWIKDPKLKSVDVNAINYMSLGYLGGSYDGVFKDTVYVSYHKKQNYPWLWPLKEWNEIVEQLPDWATESVNLYESWTDVLYINLNY